MNQRALSFALAGAAISAGFVWFLFSNTNEQIEPWDSQAGPYAACLIFVGLLNGVIFKGPVWAQYVGAVVGQFLAMLVLGQLGALIIIGLLFLMLYTLLFLAGAFFGSALRRSIP